MWPRWLRKTRAGARMEGLLGGGERPALGWLQRILREGTVPWGMISSEDSESRSIAFGLRAGWLWENPGKRHL